MNPLILSEAARRAAQSKDLLSGRKAGSRSFDGDRFAASAQDEGRVGWRNPLSRLLAFSLCVTALAPGSVRGQDRAWWDTLPRPDRPAIAWTRQSLYLPMRDGVRLAADVFLPAGADRAHRAATILHLTRYRRGLQFKDPAREAAAGPTAGLMPFLQAGYAVVIVDVRGTGASFGWRRTEFSPAEVLDGWDVLDWIVAQPWSDGAVGATGISYPGTTSELVGTLGHPALKAVAPLFSIYDFYPDVIRPGGIFLAPFFRAWADLVRQMDGNTLNGPTDPVTGVRPVDGPDGPALLAQAIAEHARNASIFPQAAALEARDDVAADGISLDQVSPHARYDTLSRRIPIYSMGGWADGFAGSQIERYLAQPSAGSRLTMGPWNHGGGWIYLPGRQPARSVFDQQGELLRFFDRYVRGIDNGVDREAPVHYFTTGSDAWKAATRWPVPHRDTTLFVQGDGRLTAQRDDAPPRDAPRVASIAADVTLGTGSRSRWNTILGGGAVAYAPRRMPNQGPHAPGWTAFESATLASDMTITGHPVLHLVAGPSDSTRQVFIYLEDVDSTGAGWLVSEGELDFRHRSIATAPAWYPRPEAFHTYRRADMAGVEGHRTVDAAIELLPVSHTFRSGHRIRIVVAGADVDHFVAPPPPPARAGFDVGSWGSRLVLPIEQ